MAIYIVVKSDTRKVVAETTIRKDAIKEFKDLPFAKIYKVKCIGMRYAGKEYSDD